MNNLDARKKALKTMLKQQPKPPKKSVMRKPIQGDDDTAYAGAPAQRGTLA